MDKVHAHCTVMLHFSVTTKFICLETMIYVLAQFLRTTRAITVYLLIWFALSFCFGFGAVFKAMIGIIGFLLWWNIKTPSRYPR